MPIGPRFRRHNPSVLPSAEQLIRNQILLNRLKREQRQDIAQPQNTPEVHYEPREGVYYHLHEEAQPVRRIMGFREWCEKVWDKRKTPPTKG